MTTSAAKAYPSQAPPPRAAEAQPIGAQATGAQTTGQGGQVLHLHRAHATVPYMTPGDIRASAQAVTSRLPAFPGRDLIFYGGLGTLAVAGALEWPIALAIGGATYILRGGARQETKAGTQQAVTPGTVTQEGTATQQSRQR